MAESVLRLRVDNKEFDDNIKHATAGVRSMIAEMRKNGEEVNKASADELKFIESLGKMETASGNAKGSLKEMQKALKDLTYEYQQMSDAERKGQIGQAMSKAMQDLKPRIEAAKKEMADLKPRIEAAKKEVAGMTKAQNTNNSSVGNLTSALGINMKSLAGWGAAIGAAKVAMELMEKVVLDGSQATGDVFRNAVSAANDMLNTFASSIATCDFSPFVNGIDDVISKAYDAAEALDKLGNAQMSLGIVNSKYGSQFQSALTTLRDKEATPEEKEAARKSAEDALAKMKEANSVVRDDIIDYVHKNIAVDSGLSAKDITWAAIENAAMADATQNADKIRASYQAAMKAQPRAIDYKKNVSFSSIWGGGSQDVWDNSKGGEEAYRRDLKAWQAANKEKIIGYTLLEKRSDEALQRLDDQISQTYQLQSATEGLQRAYNRATQTSETTKPTRKASTSSGVEKLDLNQGVGMDYGAFIKGALANANHGADGVNFAKQFAEGYKTELNNQLYDLDLASKLDDSMQTSEVLQQQLQYWEQYFDNLKTLYQKDSDEYKAAEQQKADKTKELSGQILVARKKELDANAEKRKQELIAQQQAQVEALQNAWNGAASAISSVGSALQQIEDPRAKVAGIIAQAIANIAGTFAASLKGTFTPWDWIAGAAAGAATMASTVAAIKSVTAEYHAEGGFVGGGPKGTDTINTWLTPGELVLNEAQQSAIASRLTTGSQSQQNGVGVVVEGEKMFTCLANYMNRSNKRLPV